MRVSLNRSICLDWTHLINSYRAVVRKGSVVLEIGASAQARTAELAKYCSRLIGVECLPDRNPRDFSNVIYRVGDWQALSSFIEPESVDIVVSSHVIEHVPDDVRALDETYFVLKPGGVAIINTPNRKRLVRAVIESMTGDRQFPYWEHVREYTEDDLLALIHRSPFKKYKVYPVGMGILGGPLFCFVENVPRRVRRYANFFEVHLWK